MYTIIYKVFFAESIFICFYLGNECRENEVELYIDAEYSHLQPAVRLITLALMLQYNAKFPIIFNTYQCYLKQSLSALASDIALSQNLNFYFGCKIVRGGMYLI